MARPLSVFTAARRSQLDGLEALRDTLSKAIDSCESKRDLPPLVSRHMEVTDQIEQLRAEQSKVSSSASKPATGRDEISARRAERLAGRRTG